MAVDTLETGSHFIYVTQVYFCAMYAVVIWDWLISIPREWRFIWKTKTTPVKIAYLFCRYWVIAVVPYLLFCFVLSHTQSYCERIYTIPVALAMWNQFGSEIILLIRTYAFFSQSKKVLLFLSTALGAMVGYQLYVAICQMDLLMVPFLLTANDQGIEPTGPCLPASKPQSAHLLGFFLAPVIFDTLVTGMTVGKAIRIRREHGGPSSQLIQTFLREGVFYYLLISCANLINGIFYLQPRQAISAINIPLSVMLGPLLACRLILDLRQRGSESIVSHSEGTGIAAFTTKSVGGDSPYSMRNRGKGSMLARNGMSTMNSNVLSTINSLNKDMDDSDDLELDLGVVRARPDPFRVGGNGSERDLDLELGLDAVHVDAQFGVDSNASDYEFKAAPPPTDETQISGIRVEIEKHSM